MNRTALVTGASGGIGQGVAVVLAEHGYDLAISYHAREQGARDTQAQIEALGRRCFAYRAELEKPEAPEQLVEQAYRDLGRLDVLVCNAGRDARTSILTVRYEDLRNILDTNFVGYCLLAKHAARHMVKDEIAGNIVFITSTRGTSAHPDDFLYGGIKSAVNRAAQSMALELSRYHIRVNCVAPGATDIGRNHPKDVEPGTELNGKPYYPLSAAVPMGRLGTPRDNGEMVAFLVSDKASYITGTVARVDGGLSLPGAPEHYAPCHWINEAWADGHYQAAMEDMP